MQHRQISEMNHAQSTSSINQPLVSLKNLPNRYQRRKCEFMDAKRVKWNTWKEYLTLEETFSGRYNHWVSITGRLWRSVCFEELRIRPIRGDDLWVMTSSFLIIPLLRADFTVFSTETSKLDEKKWRKAEENRSFDSRKGLS